MKLLMVKRMVCQLCHAELANGMEFLQHLEKEHQIMREQVVFLNHEEWGLNESARLGDQGSRLSSPVGEVSGAATVAAGDVGAALGAPRDAADAVHHPDHLGGDVCSAAQEGVEVKHGESDRAAA